MIVEREFQVFLLLDMPLETLTNLNYHVFPKWGGWTRGGGR